VRILTNSSSKKAYSMSRRWYWWRWCLRCDCIISWFTSTYSMHSEYQYNSVGKDCGTQYSKTTTQLSHPTTVGLPGRWPKSRPNASQNLPKSSPTCSVLRIHPILP